MHNYEFVHFVKMRRNPHFTLSAPRCVKINDNAVEVFALRDNTSTAAPSTVISGPADDIIESLSLKKAMRARAPEDIRHRSTNLENWYAQKKAHVKMPEVVTGSLNVQGVRVPYYVFMQNGAVMFTVWFNLWPAAWIVTNQGLYEKHDSLKTLYVSIETHIRDFDANACVLAPSALAAAPSVSAASSALAAAPTLASPSVSAAPSVMCNDSPVKIRLYDGSRLIFKHTADKMNIQSAVYPEIRCATFDVVLDVVNGRTSAVCAFDGAAALFAAQLKCKIPPNVGVIKPAPYGVSIGDKIGSSPYTGNPDHFVFCVNDFIVNFIVRGV